MLIKLINDIIVSSAPKKLRFLFKIANPRECRGNLSSSPEGPRLIFKGTAPRAEVKISYIKVISYLTL